MQIDGLTVLLDSDIKVFFIMVPFPDEIGDSKWFIQKNQTFHLLYHLNDP